jgi:membrane protein YqaA with SNARE-associated domain
MKPLRDLYDWVLSWSEKPFGGVALFFLALAESVIFPIPPDVLLIALVLGHRANAFKFSAICSAGSLLGGMLGYSLGQFAWLTADGFTPLAQFFFTHVPGFTEAVYSEAGRRFDQFGFEIIFSAGFTPIPYKIFTIAAGAFDVNFPVFVVASAISRTARFFLVAGLIWKFGPPIKSFIDKYFNLLAIAFTVLLVGGFIAVKYLLA